MIMKTVTLFRHAKSDWKDSPAIADFDRPLAKRGLKAAPRMGQAMRDHGLRPDLILCSPSARTRQTLSLSSPQAWDAPPEIRYEQRLYHAEATAMIDILHETGADIVHVMIVGHNPGLQDLAAELVRAGAPESVSLRENSFPTAAIATFRFEIDKWAELQPGTGELVVYTTPKQLDAA
jgi:phosphohistidine phosphatase